MHQEFFYLKHFNCILESEHKGRYFFMALNSCGSKSYFFCLSTQIWAAMGLKPNSFLEMWEETELRMPSVAYENAAKLLPDTVWMSVKNYQFKSLGLIFIGSNDLDPVFLS